MHDEELEARLSALSEKRWLRDELPAPEERRRIREEARITQEDLADALSVQRKTLMEWERGSRTPFAANLVRYIAALRVCKTIAAERQNSTTEAEAGHVPAPASLR
jgi:DNA-binding XRE family transcriptional regulator